MKVGYRRVSTVEQKFDRQELGELDKLFEEKVSGSNAERLALNEMIDFVRQDDEVIVYSIDRLARNLRDLQSIIEKLNESNAAVTTFIEAKL
jgi:DNA invertase Pin-like site-specific DNA recombinase